MFVLVTQLCVTLCDSVDCSLPGSSVYRILQARILEWVAYPFSTWKCHLLTHLPRQPCSGGHQPVLLEKAMAPHSSTLAWKISWTEEPGGPQSMGSLRVGQDSATSLSLFLSCIGEGNGNPLQYSCLENPLDGGAW